MELSPSLIQTKRPYTYGETMRVIGELLRRYPFLRAESIGKSVLGKELAVLRLGEGEKEAFYGAAFHANEWITAPVLLKFAEDYAQAVIEDEKINGEEARRLYKRTCLYLAPLVNPDGVDLVCGVSQEARTINYVNRIAREFPDIPFPAGWKANIEGVDLNLQFPADWELAKEIKGRQGYTRPAPRDYAGETPLCAPESRALYDFTEGRSFRLILAYHTQGRVIYWKYKDLEPAYSRQIGDYFARVSGYAAQETPYACGNAGYKDWFILKRNRPGYTIEAGLGENPLPLSDLERIYRENIGILSGGLKIAEML